jgi:single-stranded DNA-binding protein
MNGIECAGSGHLGREADLRRVQAGELALLAFRMVVEEAATGDDARGTWLAVLLFGERAAALARRFAKGARSYLEDKLWRDLRNDRDGERRAALKVTATLVQPLGPIGRRRPPRPPEPRGPRPRHQNSPKPPTLLSGAGERPNAEADRATRHRRPPCPPVPAVALRRGPGGPDRPRPADADGGGWRAAGVAPVELVKAIRRKCLDCCAEQPGEVGKCVATGYLLWPFRMGGDPFHGKRSRRDESDD